MVIEAKGNWLNVGNKVIRISDIISFDIVSADYNMPISTIKEFIDMPCLWVLRAKTKHGYIKLDISEYKGDLEAELEEIINKIK